MISGSLNNILDQILANDIWLIIILTGCETTPVAFFEYLYMPVTSAAVSLVQYMELLVNTGQPSIETGGRVGNGRLSVNAPTLSQTLMHRLPRPPINAPWWT